MAFCGGVTIRNVKDSLSPTIQASIVTADIRSAEGDAGGQHVYAMEILKYAFRSVILKYCCRFHKGCKIFLLLVAGPHLGLVKSGGQISAACLSSRAAKLSCGLHGFAI